MTEDCNHKKDGQVPNNNTGRTGFVVLASLLAIIAGVYAMVEPMGQRIDFLSTQMKTHAVLQAHEGAAADLAKIVERFSEVETQFRGLRELTDLQFTLLRADTEKGKSWRDGHDLRVAPLNAAQWERIKALERAVYGKEIGDR